MISKIIIIIMRLRNLPELVAHTYIIIYNHPTHKPHTHAYIHYNIIECRNEFLHVIEVINFVKNHKARVIL